jgi:hypothetical protein
MHFFDPNTVLWSRCVRGGGGGGGEVVVVAVVVVPCGFNAQLNLMCTL